MDYLTAYLIGLYKRRANRIKTTAYVLLRYYLDYELFTHLFYLSASADKLHFRPLSFSNL